jgi:cobaltochelatase CobT
MPGIRSNLDAAPVCGSAAIRSPAPSARTCRCPTALALMLREHLTGQPVPEAAHRAGVDMLRGWIEEKAGQRFRRAGRSARQPAAFQSLRSTCSSISN